MIVAQLYFKYWLAWRIRLQFREEPAALGSRFIQGGWYPRGDSAVAKN